MTLVLRGVARLLSWFPLPVVHALGIVVGWGMYLTSKRYARRLKGNLESSGICGSPTELRRTLGRAIREAGKSVTELAPLWERPQSELARWVTTCTGWEHVEAAHRAGRGIIFLTPHLGCFEITSLYYSARHPLTVLYRPPKQAGLARWMEHGRRRERVTLAPTDITGVRRIFAALKRGEAVGILPDQVPSSGEGVWAPFFGRPAYTMTLVGRLARTTGAAVLLGYAQRLPRGQGYILKIMPPLDAFPADKVDSARFLNSRIESLVRQCPEQYLWSYNRYKVPAGVAPPRE